MVPPYSNDGFRVSLDPPKSCTEPNPGFVPLLLVISSTQSCLVPVLRFHPAQDDIRPFPGAWRHDISKCAADRVGNGNTIDPELLIRMILTDMRLLERSIDDTRNRQQHLIDIIVIPLRQGFDVFTAELIGFTRCLVLDRRQWRAQSPGQCLASLTG